MRTIIKPFWCYSFMGNSHLIEDYFNLTEEKYSFHESRCCRIRNRKQYREIKKLFDRFIMKEEFDGIKNTISNSSFIMIKRKILNYKTKNKDFYKRKEEKKMINYETKKKLVKEVVSVKCDKCGKDYSIEEDVFEIQEFHHIKFVGGYDSIFGDGNKVECDICQSCLFETIKDICRIKNTSVL